MPLIGNFKPFGQYNIDALESVGGVPMIMRMLLDRGLIHGDAMTVSGQTWKVGGADTRSMFAE